MKNTQENPIKKVDNIAAIVQLRGNVLHGKGQEHVFYITFHGGMCFGFEVTQKAYDETVSFKVNVLLLEQSSQHNFVRLSGGKMGEMKMSFRVDRVI